MGPMGSLPMGFTKFPIGTGPSHGECGSFPMVRPFPFGPHNVSHEKSQLFPMGRIISHRKNYFSWEELFPMGRIISHGKNYFLSEELFPIGRMPLSHEELKKQFDRVLYTYTL